MARLESDFELVASWQRRWKFAAYSIAALLATAAYPAFGQQAEEPEEAPLETRVYNVTDLTVNAPAYEYRGTETPLLSLTGSRTPVGGLGAAGGGGTGGGMGGGGMGGMGGGMGGGASGKGGGGGFFNVPQSVLAQVGGGGGMGGSAASPSGITMDALIEAITGSIDAPYWEEVGGAGTIHALGGMLIITQTPAIHQKVDELLKAIRSSGQVQRNVTILATWLLLDAQQLTALEVKSAEGPAGARAGFAQLISEARGYRGQITCFDGQTVHLVGGGARSRIVGAIPVVGGGVAYQPIIAVPQGGAVLQVTPHVAVDAKTVVVDIHNSVVQVEDAGPPAEFLAPGGDNRPGEKSGGAPRADGVLHLDRVNLLVQQFMTTVRVPVGRPTLLGGLTQDPTSDDAKAADAPQLYLFVEVTTDDGAK